jgi:hypothetical protein
MNREQNLRRRIKLLTWLFIIGLALSGATAIPLPGELSLVVNFCGSNGESSELAHWLLRVRDALLQTQERHPFLFYGTDWLAFGHFVMRLHSLAHCATRFAIAGFSTLAFRLWFDCVYAGDSLRVGVRWLAGDSALVAPD